MVYRSQFSLVVQELTKVLFTESMPASCKPILESITRLDDEYHSTAFGGEQNM